jgi:YD repeat-containing protein
LVTLTDPAGGTQLGWDARGRLATAATPATTGTFTYDARGRRVERQIGGAATTYLYDGLDATQELSATVAHSYVRTLTIDEPLSRGGDEFYLSDALGSVLSLTNPDGTVAAAYTYEPFGETTGEGASTNPFQFTGRHMQSRSTQSS